MFAARLLFYIKEQLGHSAKNFLLCSQKKLSHKGFGGNDVKISILE